MHDLSTRAMPTSRQKGAIIAALLAAFSCLGSLGSISATRDRTTAEAPTEAGPLARPAHDIVVKPVAPGEERLTLSARLADGAGRITGSLDTGSLDWTLRDSTGAIVSHAASPVFDMPLGPGEYLVEATYGTSRLRQAVTIVTGSQLRVDFVLNVGGLRILPRLAGAGIPAGLAETRIYVRTGSGNGRLIATSSIAGEVLKLAAGQYRIESRFKWGNAVAVADVSVKPGLMTAVDINHVAGLARLTLAAPRDMAVFWQVFDQQRRIIAELEGASVSLALKPGRYAAEAQIGADRRSVQFSVEAGGNSDIALSR